ncbi:hypothetical protein D3C72_2235790 [compost metagenome]
MHINSIRALTQYQLISSRNTIATIVSHITKLNDKLPVWCSTYGFITNYTIAVRRVQILERKHDYIIQLTGA